MAKADDYLDVLWLGGVYRMPIDRFKQFCQEGTSGKGPKADSYGELLAVVAHQVDDFGPEDFEKALQQEGLSNG